VFLSLNERKMRILEALINDYISTGEPVGSRTIAKKYDIGISSATIRNELSDLEEMGFILQPHASSGRIPSDKGYRLYVDTLMQDRYRDLTDDETVYLKEVILNNINHIEYLMKETAKAISILTNYTTIVSQPELKKISIKHIQLMPMDANSIVLVIITMNKLVRNSTVSVHESPNSESLGEISIFLTELLQGKDTEDIIKIDIAEVKEQKKAYANILESVIKAIVDILTKEEDIEVYTSGVNNILTFPEFSDIEKAKTIFKTFEEKEILITLLDKKNTDSIQVVIGSENNLEQMKDCSIIRTNYKLGNQSIGTIGIIGPTRMDYYHVSSILNGIVKNINSVLYAINIDEFKAR